jgi:hypothetical protein
MHAPFIEQLKAHGIDPEELLLFLRDALNDARHFQDIKSNLLTPMQQIKLEIRLTKMEYLVVTLEKELLSSRS